jgi:enoyl-CoA hydratase/carnithine racemase
VRTRIVIDTSVLIADPGCLNQFPGCDIVIPLTVVEELDGLKSRPDDVGRSARTALRTIEDLRKRAGGSIHEPTPLNGEPGGATIHIEVNGIQRDRLIENGLNPEVPDNRIIGAALGQSRYAPTQVISNDAGLRIKAAHLGLVAAEHQPVGRAANTRPMGWFTLDVSSDIVNGLYNDGEVATSAFGRDAELVVNEFAVVRSGSQSALVRCNGEMTELLSNASPEAWGLRARSKEQRFALELLMDPDVSVIVLRGAEGAFCSGLDLKEFGAEPALGWKAGFPERWKQLHGLIFDSSKIIVGALEGAAINAGSALALACDLLIVGEKSILQVGEIQRGMAAPMNLAWLKLRHSEAIAARLLLVGEPVNGPGLLQLGIAHQCVGDSLVIESAHDLATRLSQYSSTAAQKMKRDLRQAYFAGTSDQWFSHSTK